ncbi:glycoside hydrolase family 16 protein [Pseudonocardia sp. HH130629-09]|uniref:glycoside hydrolase family 16 protein n=1 Tax=Pseudonocardia sp. HH130629-09 TaxID=1641402 RepID=UPI000B22946E|nr:glycoside hydrolase family 16 protein [Pseudonocardia sp. HH130629-09]
MSASGRHRVLDSEHDDTGAVTADSPTGATHGRTTTSTGAATADAERISWADTAEPGAWAPGGRTTGTGSHTVTGTGTRAVTTSGAHTVAETATTAGDTATTGTGAHAAPTGTGAHAAPTGRTPGRRARRSASSSAAGLSGAELFGGASSAGTTPAPGTEVPAPRAEITGGAIAGLHEPDGPVSGTGSVVAIDRSRPARSRVRRFAPLGVGAAAVLAATMVLTLLQPGTEDPSLSAALVNDPSRRSASDTTLSAGPVLANGGGSALGDAAQGASGQIGQAVAAQEAAERRAEQRRREAAERARAAANSGGAGGSGESGGSPAAGPIGGAVQVAGDGIQAALKMGWQAIGGDEFLGSTLGSNWSPYNGEGHDGQGRRTSDAISVENGNLVIRGDSQGNTGGMAWGTPQKYGKWEMRAQFPKGDKQYHPVLLLWPSEVSWPEGGEIDFAETTSASDDVSFFLHYGSSNSQKDAKKQIDITQWHNYAVEWTPDAIVGYIDGVEWFRSEDPNTFPPGPMHATIQLDYFPDGGSPEPSEMRVAWMRQYQ